MGQICELVWEHRDTGHMHHSDTGGWVISPLLALTSIFSFWRDPNISLKSIEKNNLHELDGGIQQTLQAS